MMKVLYIALLAVVTLSTVSGLKKKALLRDELEEIQDDLEVSTQDDTEASDYPEGPNPDETEASDGREDAESKDSEDPSTDSEQSLEQDETKPEISPESVGHH